MIDIYKNGGIGVKDTTDAKIMDNIHIIQGDSLNKSDENIYVNLYLGCFPGVDVEKLKAKHMIFAYGETSDVKDWKGFIVVEPSIKSQKGYDILRLFPRTKEMVVRLAKNTDNFARYHITDVCVHKDSRSQK